jgi:hypothetical protein
LDIEDQEATNKDEHAAQLYDAVNKWVAKSAIRYAPFPQDLHGSPPFIRSQYPDSLSISAARLSWGHAPAELIA